MNWHEIMERELKRAGTGAKLIEVPSHRRLTAKGAVKLEYEIQSSIHENDAMRNRSYINSCK